MYIVGTFVAPSPYAGRRAVHDGRQLLIEGVGLLDVRQLPGYAASGQFAWADEAARQWGEQSARAAGAPVYAAPVAQAPAPTQTYAPPASPPPGPQAPPPYAPGTPMAAAPSAGIPTVAIVIGAVVLAAIALVVTVVLVVAPLFRVEPGPYVPPVVDGPVTPVTPYTPPYTPPVVPETPATERTVTGTWRVTSGEDVGSTYEFGSDGRVWWNTTSGDNWEMEWWVQGTTLTMRRETLYLEFDYEISSDGWTMYLTKQEDGSERVLARQ